MQSRGGKQLFIKLKNNFLFLMFGFLSAVLIAAFISIYAVSYFKASSEINEKLDFNEVLEVTSEGKVSLGDKETSAIVVNRTFPNLGIYFNLLVDENGKILVIDSALELPFNVYEKAGNDAWKNNNSQTVKFENRLWRYKITPAEAQIVINDEIPRDSSSKNYQIRFLDVTETTKSLNALKNTLILTCVILLFIFFFMSVYFSNRAIKPMKIAWDNQQRFFSDASHELKTPLSIITANIGVLYANKEETINSQLKWLEYALNGTKRMSGLVQSMLTLSKIETDNTFLSKSRVNISNALIEAVNSFGAAASDKNIDITKNITADILMNTYPVLMEQLIHILIDNAVRYTPFGGTIDITLFREKSIVILKVENSGPGISKEDLPKIFDRFFRSDISRTASGDSYGLGLSMAKSSMEKIGGKIEAASIENEKTTFTIKFFL